MIRISNVNIEQFKYTQTYVITVGTINQCTITRRHELHQRSDAHLFSRFIALFCKYTYDAFSFISHRFPQTTYCHN